MTNYILEACVDSIASAQAALAGGANRIELCANLIIGGTTPSPVLFEALRKCCQQPIHVLIRPRFGDFCYQDSEFAIIKQEVELFRQLGAEGVVFGVLLPDGRLDMKRMAQLCQEAGPLAKTLHRAFDLCENPFLALEQAIELGMNTILTSGQQSSALLGKDLLKELQKAAGNRIEILAGAGINGEAISQLLPYTAISSYHMSGSVIKDSPMQYRQATVSMGLPSVSEYQIWESSTEKFQAAQRVLEEF